MDTLSTSQLFHDLDRSGSAAGSNGNDDLMHLNNTRLADITMDDVTMEAGRSGGHCAPIQRTPYPEQCRDVLINLQPLNGTNIKINKQQPHSRNVNAPNSLIDAESPAQSKHVVLGTVRKNQAAVNRHAQSDMAPTPTQLSRNALQVISKIRHSRQMVESQMRSGRAQQAMHTSEITANETEASRMLHELADGGETFLMNVTMSAALPDPSSRHLRPTPSSLNLDDDEFSFAMTTPLPPSPNTQTQSTSKHTIPATAKLHIDEDNRRIVTNLNQIGLRESQSRVVSVASSVQSTTSMLSGTSSIRLRIGNDRPLMSESFFVPQQNVDLMDDSLERTIENIDNDDIIPPPRPAWATHLSPAGRGSASSSGGTVAATQKHHHVRREVHLRPNDATPVRRFPSHTSKSPSTAEKAYNPLLPKSLSSHTNLNERVSPRPVHRLSPNAAAERIHQLRSATRPGLSDRLLTPARPTVSQSSYTPRTGTQLKTVTAGKSIRASPSKMEGELTPAARPLRTVVAGIRTSHSMNVLSTPSVGSRQQSAHTTIKERTPRFSVLPSTTKDRTPVQEIRKAAAPSSSSPSYRTACDKQSLRSPHAVDGVYTQVPERSSPAKVVKRDSLRPDTVRPGAVDMQSQHAPPSRLARSHSERSVTATTIMAAHRAQEAKPSSSSPHVQSAVKPEADSPRKLFARMKAHQPTSLAHRPGASSAHITHAYPANPVRPSSVRTVSAEDRLNLEARIAQRREARLASNPIAAQNERPPSDTERLVPSQRLSSTQQRSTTRNVAPAPAPRPSVSLVKSTSQTRMVPPSASSRQLSQLSRSTSSVSSISSLGSSVGNNLRASASHAVLSNAARSEVGSTTGRGVSSRTSMDVTRRYSIAPSRTLSAARSGSAGLTRAHTAGQIASLAGPISTSRLPTSSSSKRLLADVERSDADVPRRRNY